MKTNVILLAVALFFITSCTQNEDEDLNKVIKNESETLTGSFELSDEPQIINFGGKTITFETIKILKVQVATQELLIPQMFQMKNQV
ncbi:hypothetical protein [Bacteroides sp.]|uniref:hypothetical protein n=1 Tax=Bacteroides sp. TaxID=29523 RepID=UPI0025BE6942|nr:hypothetical protein [Bacteroides sp.]